MAYSVGSATITHVHKLAASMREADADEARAMGGCPRRMLRASFRSSLYTRAWFIDGKVAAMWGVCGDILGEVGRPWLVTAPAVETLPVSGIRIAKQELEAFLYLKPILENYVDARYHKAIRLLEVLGFHIDPPVPYGRLQAPFCRFSMVR